MSSQRKVMSDRRSHGVDTSRPSALPAATNTSSGKLKPAPAMNEKCWPDTNKKYEKNANDSRLTKLTAMPRAVHQLP
jgi:hypothetical protein